MIYAVIDTNVLVSALLTSNPLSATKKVLNLLSSCKVTPLINDEVISEYIDVLHRNKFPFKTEDIDNLISFIQQVGIDTTRTPFPESMPDEDDRVFFEITPSSHRWSLQPSLLNWWKNRIKDDKSKL